VTAAGEVLATGSGQLGQLGMDTSKLACNSFRGIQSICDIIDIAAGASHSVAVNANGQVYVWGSNDFCELGLPGKEPRFKPTLLESLSAHRITSVNCGPHSTIAVNGTFVPSLTHSLTHSFTFDRPW